MPANFDPRAQAEASLHQLATLVFQRDPRVISEFTDDALLVGSEPDEIAAGRAQLQSFFERIFERPMRISWEWDTIRASASGELCWLFAEGVFVLTTEGGQDRAPYRLSGVLLRIADKWRWQQFHGSEPA
jgi:ketosteroid isomerase-like protein